MNNKEIIEKIHQSILTGYVSIDELNALGAAYYKENDIDKARLVYNEILRIQPNHSDANKNIAYIIVKQNLNKEVSIREKIDAIKSALEYDSYNALIWDILAVLYLKDEKKRRALVAMRMAIKIDPENIPMHLRLGRIYTLLNDWNSAFEEYKFILQKEPENQEALEDIKLVNIQLEKSSKINKHILIGMITTLDESMQKVCDHLYIGSESAAKSVSALAKNNITHILNVASEVPCHFEHSDLINIVYHKESILDNGNCDIISNGILLRCLSFLESSIKSGGNVLVHCQAGISRSGSIVVSYLMKQMHIPYQTSLQHVRKVRPCVCPNSGFEQQIKRFFQE